MAFKIRIPNFPLDGIKVDSPAHAEELVICGVDYHGSLVKIHQLLWSNNEPWPEANLWILSRTKIAPLKKPHLATCAEDAKKLRLFMDYLEDNNIEWWDLPQIRSKRSISKYRQYLISRNEEKKAPRGAPHGKLSTSTTKERIGVVRRFYQWMKTNDLLPTGHHLWEEKNGVRAAIDKTGREYLVKHTSTDFTISSRKRTLFELEDGVLPVSYETRAVIIKLSREILPIEIQLMLEVAFFTGLRLGSICDLRLETIEYASKDPAYSSISYLSVGPDASPVAVKTKFEVTGQVMIPTNLLGRLKEYSLSVRRLTREAKSSMEDSNLLFLNVNGRTYDAHNDGESSSVNVHMHRLRNWGKASGINISDFYFHRCRATFATSIATAAESYRGTKGINNVVALIRGLLLHKDDSTAMGYISYVADAKILSDQANEYTRQFLGHKLEGYKHNEA